MSNKNDNIKTPYEKYNDIKPTIKHLHVWGCDVYYHNHQEKRKSKLDVTGIPGIFVGYDMNNDIYYRILDVDKNIIVISHDVTFFDEKFDEMKKLCMKMNEENNEFSVPIPKCLLIENKFEIKINKLLDEGGVKIIIKKSIR